MSTGNWEIVNRLDFVEVRVIDPRAMLIEKAPFVVPAWTRVHGPVPHRMAVAWMEKNNRMKGHKDVWVVRRDGRLAWDQEQALEQAQKQKQSAASV